MCCEVSVWYIYILYILQTWPTQSTAQILVEKTEESAVIKIDTNSIVQDASNQTEDSDDKDEDEEYTSEEVNEKNGNDVDEEHESSKSENEEEVEVSADKVDSIRKLKVKRNKTATSEKIIYNDANPDFMGLQLLLNGIERVEHSVNATTNAEEEDPIKEEADDSDKDTDVPAPNGLEILCALADQRFKEEKKNSESDDLSVDEDDLDDKKVPFHKGSKICKFYFWPCTTKSFYADGLVVSALHTRIEIMNLMRLEMVQQCVYLDVRISSSKLGA